MQAAKNSSYEPLLMDDDEDSSEDQALLNEVNRTLGDGAPSNSIINDTQRYNKSNDCFQMMCRVRKGCCRRNDHFITNIFCVVCIILMLANLVVIKFAVMHGFDWLQDHRNSTISNWVDGKLSMDTLTNPASPKMMNLKDKQRIVHLDLKGAPPKLDYFLKAIPVFSQLGATGVLMEYEDMFPFHDNLADIASGNAYSNDDIKKILDACASHNLTVIPLVQTFGHMEYVLKYEKYRSLRLVDEYPNYLNPNLPQSDSLVYTMVEQMIQAHPNIEYLHIGCDEVRYLPSPQDDVYLKHVTKVAKYIKDRHPHITVIIWEDVLRSISTSVMQKFDLKSLLQPMVWAYGSPIEDRVTHEVWDNYSKVFTNVWFASAFKGTGSPWAYYTDVEAHVANHLAWMRTMSWLSSEHPSLNVLGIALTGWSRYDHFGSIAEPIPVSLPSLAVCLQMLIEGEFSQAIVHRSSQLLDCAKDVPVFINNTMVKNNPIIMDTPDCDFPGYAIYELLTFNFRYIILQFNSLLVQIPTSRDRGWLNEFSIKYNYSSPFKLQARVLNPIKSTRKKLSPIKLKLKQEFNKVFFEDMISEWLITYISYITNAMDKAESQAITLMARRAWPRRPIV